MVKKDMFGDGDWSQYKFDAPELSADTIVWLSQERRGCLNVRVVYATWDMKEFLEKKDTLTDQSLKLSLVI